MGTWLDRPLSVAGRLMVRESGRIVTKLVNVDRDLLIIPNVAIHMNRNANDGMKFAANIDTYPLFGGADGLDFYRRISRDYAAHLNPGGTLLMEVGAGQAEDVAEMFPKAEIIKDICGIERVVAGRR